MKNNKRDFKDAIYEQHARIGKAISAPKRIELLDLLMQGERTVESLAKEAGISVANASQHLQVLRAASLVAGKKEGLFVTYRIADKGVSCFVRNLQMLAKNQIAEVNEITRHFLAGHEGLEAIDKKVLLERVKSGTAIVLDVRPIEEYRYSHISGAISIPLAQLEARIAELPKNQEIVAYCRGPYCMLAVQAVEMLHAKGFQAIRLEDSVADWEAEGLPIAMGKNS